jgi:branched-chain amino acid transport system ATP-binding protein
MSSDSTGAGTGPAVKRTPAVRATGVDTDTLLQTQGVTKRFGGLTAIDSVDFGIDEGELRCLIGPNGAGKSTLLNLITGRHGVTEGRIFYDGREVTDLSPHERVRRGIGMKFQVPSVFESLSAAENVRLPLQRVVEGDLSDRVLRVVDLKRLFGVTTTVRHTGDIEEGEHVIAFGSRADGEVNAWLVDEVRDAVTVDTDDLLEANGLATHVEGVVTADGDQFVWVDAAAINDL